MRAFSLQRRQSLPNVFARPWRRWMTRRADQLLETARLGSDNLEYLTHDRKAADCDLSPVADGHANDLLRRLSPLSVSEAGRRELEEIERS
jgi:hypothetical protein